MSIATLFHDVEEAFRRTPSGVSLNETQETFVLEAFVAGVKPQDIQITREKQSLCIEAKTSPYSYSYLVPLPVGEIDESAAPDAVAELGILKITFPKAKAAKPIKITVKGS